MAVRESNAQRSKKFPAFLYKIVLVAILAFTVLLFSLPIIFHFIVNATEVTEFSYSASCESLDYTWSTISVSINDSCTAVKYGGQKCWGMLQKWRNCASEKRGAETVEVNNSLVQQIQLEVQLKEVLSFLDLFPDCQKEGYPFLCQYYFPLKDCSSGLMYTASREECTYISTEICKQPWNIATDLGFENLLPKCDSLPSNEFESESGSNMTDMENFNEFNDSVNCRDDFFLKNNTCLPLCDKFEMQSHTETMLILSFEVVAATICSLASLLILVLSAIKHKVMFRFPSIFLILLAVDTLTAGTIILIVAIDRSALLCGSKNLIQSIDDPTIFCSISGAVWHYCLLKMLIWWFAHTSVFFYDVVFPFHSQRTRKLGKQKYILGVVVFLGHIIPIPPVVISLTTKDHEYRIFRFPPSVCLPDEEMLFYSTVLTVDIMVGIGVCYLIIIFWIISRSQRNQRRKFSTAEKKLILVISFFIVFGVYTMLHYGIFTANGDKLIDGMKVYFICEASGHVPGKCDRNVFERHFYPSMSCISYILMGLIPLSILNFVVNWNKVKGIVCKRKELPSFQTKYTGSKLYSMQSPLNSGLQTERNH